MRSHATHLVAVVLVLLGIIPAARSAESYKSGDKVEVFFLNKWYPAVVVSQNMRGEVLADFVFAGPTRRLFKNPEVRWAYESGAMSKGRMWSDASGSFKLKAALITQNDKEVTLRKPDMSEVVIELDKLSEADREFLKRLSKGSPAVLAGERPPDHPPVETFDSGDVFGTELSWGSRLERPAIEPDPIPAYLKLKQGGVGFFREDFLIELAPCCRSVGTMSGFWPRSKACSREICRLAWAGLRWPGKRSSGGNSCRAASR